MIYNKKCFSQHIILNKTNIFHLSVFSILDTSTSENKTIFQKINDTQSVYYVGKLSYSDNLDDKQL